MDQPFNNPLARRAIEKQCYEKRVFYKMISGFHASVSTQISYKYFNSTSGTWGRNFDIFHERVGKHPDRMQNLYLVYMLVFRAIEKLVPILEDYNFGLNDPTLELETKVF